MATTVLITGTSNGFGNDIAKTLASAGRRVFATMRETQGRHRETAADLATHGVEVLDLDVTDNASVDAAFKTLFAKSDGRLDVLINNAGVASAGLSETFTPEQVRDLFDVNVIGIQRVMRAALPAMRKQGSGLIINMGSILGRVTIPFLGLYGASKHAVEAMTDSYRVELSQLGIDVVLIQPGPYPTKLYTAIQKPSDPARAESYGEVAALPGEFSKYIEGVFSGKDAPDPHDIAKTIERLLETPAGQRPARIIVGAPFGADAANDALQPIQEQLVVGVGFKPLLTLKTA